MINGLKGSKDKLLTPVGEEFMWFGYQHNPRYTPTGM